jgi:linearmycin/streptolysin S transport system ATP-binding protein
VNSSGDRVPGTVRVEGVRKRYGQIEALAGVSFDVRRGECFGLLGPNGAGKTTTLAIVCSLARPDSGTVTVDGVDVSRDPERARRSLGVVPQELSIYDDLTARENLQFFGSLFGLRGARLAERTDDALLLAGLDDRANDRVRTFSGGMKRRLNFAIGLVHEPAIVLLDEPTVGVDPQSRNHLFEMVTALKNRGTTVLYTTHYMEEAERLCDRIAILDRGRLVALGTQDELVAKVGAREQVDLEFAAGERPPAAALRAALGGLETTERPNGVRVNVDGVPALQDLLGRLDRASLRPRSVSLRRPDLESVFLALTGRALRDKEK